MSIQRVIRDPITGQQIKSDIVYKGTASAKSSFAGSFFSSIISPFQGANKSSSFSYELELGSKQIAITYLPQNGERPFGATRPYPIRYVFNGSFSYSSKGAVSGKIDSIIQGGISGVFNSGRQSQIFDFAFGRRPTNGKAINISSINGLAGAISQTRAIYQFDSRGMYNRAISSIPTNGFTSNRSTLKGLQGQNAFASNWFNESTFGSSDFITT
jgi:hypothetical protein